MLSHKIAGINLHLLRKDELLSMYRDHTIFLSTINLQFIYFANRDPHFKSIIENSYSTIDAQLLSWICLLLSNRNYNEFVRNAGSEFFFDFCKEASVKNKSIFLLGGETDANMEAVKNVQKQYGIKISGYSPPFMNYPFTDSVNSKISDSIKEFRPDFLFVGFGAPKQEFWIHDNLNMLNSCGIKYVTGVGGVFDMVAKKVYPAPKFIKDAGVEWLWRFLQQPKRRFKPVLQRFISLAYLFR